MLTNVLNLLKEPKKIKRLPHFLKLNFNRYRRYRQNREDYSNLIKLITLSKTLHNSHIGKTKILFAPGFNINPIFTHHDVIIASLLHSKGATIHYTSGHGRLLSPLMYGGVWSSGSIENDFRNLRNGEDYALQLFSRLGETSDMSGMVSKAEVGQIKDNVSDLNMSEILNYSYNDIMLGHDAMNRIRNLHLVSDITLIGNYENLLLNELVNCVVYAKFFERVIESVKPDRIFSHDSFYYPWSIMCRLANKYNIPFYNYYCTIRKDAYTYANHKPAMIMDMTKLWDNVKEIPLSLMQKRQMSLLIEERIKGNVGALGQKRFYNSLEKENIINFTKLKPTAVLYGNVVWDLAALDKEIIFKSIREGYIETIKYFIKHPQYQLIIKSHPDEENPKIPITVERLKYIIKAEIGNLPDNIIVLDSRVAITSFDLFPLTKCSLVQTTTAGLESVIFGTPTITMSNAHYKDKGFTYDPKNWAEYFSILDTLLPDSNDYKLNEKLSELATKYYYYFYYELFYEYGIPSMAWGGMPTPIRKSSPQEFLTNKRLDYIIDTIIKGDRIIYQLNN